MPLPFSAPDVTVTDALHQHLKNIHKIAKRKQKEKHSKVVNATLHFEKQWESRKC